jgi:hypothetical protein
VADVKRSVADLLSCCGDLVSVSANTVSATTVVFSVVTQHNYMGGYNVSDEPAASIFKSLDFS